MNMIENLNTIKEFGMEEFFQENPPFCARYLQIILWNKEYQKSESLLSTWVDW